MSASIEPKLETTKPKIQAEGIERGVSLSSCSLCHGDARVLYVPMISKGCRPLGCIMARILRKSVARVPSLLAANRVGQGFGAV